MKLVRSPTAQAPSRLAAVPYSGLTSAFVEQIPELRFPVDQLRRTFKDGESGEHRVFAEVISPFLEEQLLNARDRELLRRVFAFLEEAAKHPDVLVRDVVAQSVCESLCGESQPWSAHLRKLMGPATAQLMKEACEARHRPH